MTVVLPTAAAVKPTVRHGSRGATVAELQARLNALGIPFPPLEVDGIFLDRTLAAVRAFQAQARIAVDGIVGPQTWGALDAAAAGDPPGVVRVVVPDVPDVIPAIVPGVVPVSFPPPLGGPPSGLPPGFDGGPPVVPAAPVCGFLGPGGTLLSETAVRGSIVAMAAFEMQLAWRSKPPDPLVLSEDFDVPPAQAAALQASLTGLRSLLAALRRQQPPPDPAVPAEVQSRIDFAQRLLAGHRRQLGHLVRYWLSAARDILPSTMEALWRNAADGGATVDALLAGPTAVPHGGDRTARPPTPPRPADLRVHVDQGVEQAKLSHKDDAKGPWSAAFVVSCARAAAIALRLESEDGATHVGKEKFLATPIASVAHLDYVRGALRRRQAGTTGTYHAFGPGEMFETRGRPLPLDPGRLPVPLGPLKPGDIIVQDREEGLASGDQVLRLDFNTEPGSREDKGAPRPGRLPPGRKTHGDIIVEVDRDHAVTVGGNLENGAGRRGSVRRRLFPLSAAGTPARGDNVHFLQEDDAGRLTSEGPQAKAGKLHPRATSRIFCVLRLIPDCIP
jgi:hypothetical protein